MARCWALWAEGTKAAMTFDTIYRTNAWNGDESRSGPGSGSIATARVKHQIVGLVKELKVKSVLDVGCGDGFWMPDLPGYVGFDVSRTAIALARTRHPDREYILHWPAASFDLVITRDAMQHLSLEEGTLLLAMIYATGSSWLLASTYLGGENVDIVTGDAYSPDLEAEPFSMGPPERLIFDGYHYHETEELRDPRKHLGLWRL